MPSALPIPTLGDLLQAFHDGVQSFDETEDRHDGSKYDDFAGIGAIFWSQEAQFTRDAFLACYDGTADSDDLTNRLETRYGIPRILDTYGVGVVTLARASAAAGSGTVWTGTRIAIPKLLGLAEGLFFASTSDVQVSAGGLTATVPIRATVRGSGTSVNSTVTPFLATIADPLWDNTWIVTSIQCADGTDFELARDYLARVYATRFADRNGYQQAIVDACIAQGAANVAGFASNFAGPGSDYGTNVVYVGDASFSGSSLLVKLCQLAMESVANCGAVPQVLPMTTEVLPVTATIYLWDDPGSIDTVDLEASLLTGLQQYFTGVNNGFRYQIDGMAGAMTDLSSEVQSIVFANPTTSENVTVGSPPGFPNVLTRWQIDPTQVRLTFAGPQ